MKMCESCGQRPAEVEFVQIIGNLHKRMSLCRQCAASEGLSQHFEIFRRLAHMFEQQQVMQTEADVPEVVCSQCRTSFEEFARTGLLGCPDCYTEFKEHLTPILRRMHGVTRAVVSNTGENPEKSGEDGVRDTKAELKTRLEKAVAEENYELAAELRDRLKSL